MSLLSKCPTCETGSVTNSHRVCSRCREKERAAMKCPHCGWGPYVPKEEAHKMKIDGVKCSVCFERRNTFINLEIVSDQIETRFEILDL